MKRFRIALLVVGVLLFVSSLIGFQRIRISSSDGLHVYHFGLVAARVATGVIGLFLAALGTLGSARTLWYTGSAFFILSAISLLLQAVRSAMGEEETFTRIWGWIFAGCLCAYHRDSVSSMVVTKAKGNESGLTHQMQPTTRSRLDFKADTTGAAWLIRSIVGRHYVTGNANDSILFNVGRHWRCDGLAVARPDDREYLVCRANVGGSHVRRCLSHSTSATQC